jgi:hypothetical protein
VNSESKSYKFKTMPKKLSKSISFVQGGDMYYKTLTYMEQLCLEAAKRNPHFALLGGDIADSSSHEGEEEVQHWLDWLICWEKSMVTSDGRLVPIVAAIGNHEVKGKFHKTPEEAKMFFTLFPMPKKKGYMVLDFGKYLSLFLLDSGHVDEVDGKQAKWLSSALKKRVGQLHKFAVYHVPAFPAAIQKKIEPIEDQIRQFWVPKFEQYGLNVAFEHHEHTYKRTHPIRNDKIDPQGVVYLGEGAFGADKLHEVHPLEERWYLAFAQSARHFIYAELTPKKRSFEAIGLHGEVIDAYSATTK